MQLADRQDIAFGDVDNAVQCDKVSVLKNPWKQAYASLRLALRARRPRSTLSRANRGARASRPLRGTCFFADAIADRARNHQGSWPEQTWKTPCRFRQPKRRMDCFVAQPEQ
jgi:hypothetical protein